MPPAPHDSLTALSAPYKDNPHKNRESETWKKIRKCQICRAVAGAIPLFLGAAEGIDYMASLVQLLHSQLEQEWVGGFRF